MAPNNLRVRNHSITTLAAFGGVGAVAFVVDVGVYNLVRSTILSGSPIWSKVVSVAVATFVAWIGNRTLAFRDSRRENVVREAVLFALINVGGLLTAAGCLFVSHYLLGLTSALADNISGNLVGLVLGTAFRYLGYRFVVFSTADFGQSGDSPHPAPVRLRTPPRMRDRPGRGDQSHGIPAPAYRTPSGGTH